MPEKILVVDDEQDIADLLEVYLQNENYTVYKFYSAREALDCIEKQEIDLAILDIMLPDVNGFSICQKIREKYTYPIIMLALHPYQYGRRCCFGRCRTDFHIACSNCIFLYCFLQLSEKNLSLFNIGNLPSYCVRFSSHTA